jgi:hypothetical protein
MGEAKQHSTRKYEYLKNKDGNIQFTMSSQSSAETQTQTLTDHWEQDQPLPPPLTMEDQPLPPPLTMEDQPLPPPLTMEDQPLSAKDKRQARRRARQQQKRRKLHDQLVQTRQYNAHHKNRKWFMRPTTLDDDDTRAIWHNYLLGVVDEKKAGVNQIVRSFTTIPDDVMYTLCAFYVELDCSVGLAENIENVLDTHNCSTFHYQLILRWWAEDEEVTVDNELFIDVGVNNSVTFRNWTGITFMPIPEGDASYQLKPCCVNFEGADHALHHNPDHTVWIEHAKRVRQQVHIGSDERTYRVDHKVVDDAMFT